MAQQQGPKGQFMTMMLLFMCIFLGFQLLNPNKPAPDTRKLSEVEKQMQEFNRDVKDVEMALTNNNGPGLLNVYKQKVEQTAKDEKWTAEQKQAKELEGVVLTSHAKYKGALTRANDPTKTALVHKKLNDAWLLMQPFFERYHNTPLWDKPVAVTPDSKLNKAEVTPRELYDNLVADLSTRNRTELVWGLLPGWTMIDATVKITGAQPGFSYWFAAFLLAFIVRLLIWPWSMKQYKLGRQMMQLQPYVKEVQEKFKDKRTGKIPQEKQAMASSEMMALYKEYGVSPLAGCSSALLQMPIYMVVLAAMQLYRFEFVKGTFLWIHEGAGKFAGLNLAPNLGQTDQVLILIYGVSMLVSQYLMPITDPTQVRQQRLMGLAVAVIITISMFGYPLPSAFTLYWVFANVLATAQAVYVYRFMPKPVLEKVQTVPGGVKAKPGFMEKLQSMMEEQAKMQQPGQSSNNGEAPSNGKPKNALPEPTIDTKAFGKGGSPRSKKKK